MQPLFSSTCVLVGGAGRSGTTILSDLIASHPQAAMLIEDSFTFILQDTQMLASVRSRAEEADRAALFGTPMSFLHPPFDWVRAKLEDLASIEGYRARFDKVLRVVMADACKRSDAAVFGSKSTMTDHWEDLDYLRGVLSDLRLVFIIRNPINVVASSLRRRNNALLGLDVWHIHTVEEAVAEWKAAMRTMAGIWREHGGPILPVLYEALCAQPGVTQAVYEFLGLPPFDGHPALFRREVTDMRATLSGAELDYLTRVFPGVDDRWPNSSFEELLSFYSEDGSS